MGCDRASRTNGVDPLRVGGQPLTAILMLRNVSGVPPLATVRFLEVEVLGNRGTKLACFPMDSVFR